MTAVATIPRAPLALSTVKRRKTPFALSIVSRNKTQFALSTVDPRIAELERERKAARISHSKLCRWARVHPSTWFYLRRGAQAPKGDTLERLRAALQGRRRHAGRLDETLIVAAHRLVMAALARAGGAEPAAVLAQDFSAERPRDPAWLRAAELRRQAMYVLAVELDVGNAALGRAIGCSRQNVKQARDQVDETRAARRELAQVLEEIGRIVRT